MTHHTPTQLRKLADYIDRDGDLLTRLEAEEAAAWLRAMAEEADRA